MEALDAEVERQVQAWQARIGELRGRHVAIEALWDGDTQGWWLDVAVVTKRSWWRPGPWTTADFYARSIATLRYGGDIRLFQGNVPPWPEAMVAQRAGKRVCRLLGLEFYFPSPEHPDDDCPHWWDRERAVRCRTCGKPLTRGRAGPHQPPDQCWPCQLLGKQRNAVLADAPGRNRFIACVVEVNGTPGRTCGFSLESGDLTLGGWLAAVLGQRNPPVALSERTETVLTQAEARAVHSWCEQRIDELFRVYRHDPGTPMDFSAPATFSWRGVEHTIQRKFNPVGEELNRVFAIHKLTSEAIAGGVLHVFGNSGVTDRDATFLARLRVRPLTPGELQAAFPFLPLDEIEKTLSKLEQRGFVVRDGGAVRPLLKGVVMEVAGP